ncbi:nuclear transport factor 2 family protein [Sphingomonas sp. SUN019]|uniref:nuclear transport factor 2 family protein n=1 Tax=Sphingomonas sp. SUN019 TaxID=2937788 RepID=UPI00216416E6|nr:nuclear transport factor 2 family protein [Sphingomonas sp. SUN019]UVO49711.1 nuclear transport factor 2 family protein [Sphingomonas sp. SUN019]
MTDALLARIDQLESRFAILDLTSDYCLGFDKRDWERFIGIWWEDAVWEVGPPFGNFDGHEGITRAVHDILWPAWKQSTHYNTNLRVTFDGADQASGVSDVDCIGTTADGQAQTVAATYTDDFERRGGVWKIARRHVKMHHFSPLVGITLSAPA